MLAWRYEWEQSARVAGSEAGDACLPGDLKRPFTLERHLVPARTNALRDGKPQYARRRAGAFFVSVWRNMDALVLGWARTLSTSVPIPPPPEVFAPTSTRQCPFFALDAAFSQFTRLTAASLQAVSLHFEPRPVSCSGWRGFRYPPQRRKSFSRSSEQLRAVYV